MKYVQVRDGVVVTDALPTTGRLSDGSDVSGFDRLPHEVLIGEGWLPLTVDMPENWSGEPTVLSGYTVGAESVTAHYVLAPPPEFEPVAPTPQELQQQFDDLTDLLAFMMGGGL